MSETDADLVRLRTWADSMADVLLETISDRFTGAERLAALTVITVRFVDALNVEVAHIPGYSLREADRVASLFPSKT